jgi:hypothetical protein
LERVVKTFDLEDIVLSLTGPIDPVGETNADNARFENLKVLCDLVERLLVAIDYVNTGNRKSHEYSRQRAGEYADKFYDRIGITNE